MEDPEELTPEEVERAEKKARKKEKKEAKRKQRELEEEVEDDHSKKKSKKEKKQHEEIEEPASVIVDAEAEVEEGHSKKKKSDKKEKKEKTNASSESSSASSKPISIGDLTVQVYPSEDIERFPPCNSFEDLYNIINKKTKNTNLPIVNTIRNYIRNKSFATPSVIQSYCWSPLFAKQDVIGIASTGSGKTLAFLFPGLIQLELKKTAGQIHNSFKPSPKILVIAPTRELAMQSYQVTVDVGIPGSICVYGGVPKHLQLQEMKKLSGKGASGLDIVIATPGRLLDFVVDGSMSLSEVFYLVLDEADRMLDEGFEPAIRQIIGQCPSYETRQTVMLSATWPEEIRNLANNYLNTSKITRVVVGSEDLAANHRVTQIVEVLENNPRVKDQRLFQLLDKYHKSRSNKILIFVLYKVEAVKLQQTLQSRGFRVGGIHGNKSQNDRTDALENFRNGSVPLLIATDVAARGLDIPNVEYVINYSFPLTVEDYVHRIGRTGRAGKTGVSHTFFTDFDKGLAGGLVGVLQEANQEVCQDLYKFPLITKKKSSKLYGDFGPKAELSGQKSVKITFDD